MGAGLKKSRKWLVIGAVCAVVAIGAYGLVTLRGASAEIDPARIAVVERGTMVRSVVATGKVEPITKVEIKSKANGLINVLHVDVDTVVNEGDVLVELDKEQLLAALRGAQAKLEAARASLEGAEAARSSRSPKSRSSRRPTASSTCFTWTRPLAFDLI